MSVLAAKGELRKVLVCCSVVQESSLKDNANKINKHILIQSSPISAVRHSQYE